MYIVPHLHKENHLWVFNNVGKVAFCCSNSRSKCNFVLTVGIKKAQFVHPGGNENGPKTSKMFCKSDSPRFWSIRSQWSATGPVLEGLHPARMVGVWALSGPKPLSCPSHTCCDTWFLRPTCFSTSHQHPGHTGSFPPPSARDDVSSQLHGKWRSWCLRKLRA